MKKRRHSLSIHITSLFLFLATLLGGGLIAISYFHSQQLLSEIAKELSEENAQKLESSFEKSISPILTALDMMATSALPPQPTSSETEHEWLHAIDLIFQRNKELVALFYGSEDGSTTQFRPLRSKNIREKFRAPRSAILMLHYTNIQGKNDIVFYDKSLNVITSRHENNNEYDPRTRPWYKNVKADGEIALTQPYPFYYLKKTGVTLSRYSLDRKAVVAADLSLNTLTQKLKSLAFSANTKLVLFDSRFRLLAGFGMEEDATDKSQKLGELGDTLFSTIMGRNSSKILYDKVEFDGETWSVTLTPVKLTRHIRLLLAEATPEEDLLLDMLSIRNKQIIAAFCILILSFIIIRYTANRLTIPLVTLNKLTENIRGFHFKKTRYPKSVIKEVNDLTHSIELMEHTLHDLLGLLRDTASNHDFEHLTKIITTQSYLITKAETIVLSILDKDENKFTTTINHSIIPFKIDINQLIDNTPWMRAKLAKGDVIPITKTDNVIKNYADIFYNAEVYLFPMLNRHKSLVGILIVGYERQCKNIQKDKHVFLKELLNFAEIAKENIDQMQQQKQMLTSFIELMASAIDTKSPYTGAHCQRVPKIARLLTEAAHNDNQYFPDFSMDEKKWEELYFAAWLHDCGKVTTPEFIVDKATKLETIYNRIHEIRMRFELIKSQEETECWKKINEGANKEQCLKELKQFQQQLDKEFEFVAQCNLGHERMTDISQRELKRIAGRSWIRTLDDQLGTSWIEKQRGGSQTELPAKEFLICDKDEHMISWEENRNPKDTWGEEYNLKPSNVQYNRGELHNLSITAGTLNNEERFMINDHIVQTIELLKRLPYPEHMKDVPDIAGNHHERIDGKGYPRGLTQDNLSIQARVMAIADIFEAITSNDRPYKKAYTIEKALSIMTEQATSGHIDPKLYLLFLENKIDEIYAERFLDPATQQTKVDRKKHIRQVKEHIRNNI